MMTMTTIIIIIIIAVIICSLSHQNIMCVCVFTTSAGSEAHCSYNTGETRSSYKIVSLCSQLWT